MKAVYRNLFNPNLNFYRLKLNTWEQLPYLEVLESAHSYKTAELNVLGCSFPCGSAYQIRRKLIYLTGNLGRMSHWFDVFEVRKGEKLVNHEHNNALIQQMMF